MNLPAYSIIDFLLSSVLAFISLGIGLSLTSDSFRNIFLSPKPLIIGLASQIIVLPAIALMVSYYSDLAPPLKVGLIILAACPGGTTSGFLTYFFKGNVALSMTFTSINSVITLFTIPFIVNLSLIFYFGRSTIIHLSYLETIIQIFSITIIPAVSGVMIRTYRSEFALKIQRPLRIILTIALGIVFIILFFAEDNKGGTGITAKEILSILPSALLLNILCMIWGFMLGQITRLGIRNSYTIGIEASVHNTTLAFLVAGTLLNNHEMIKPALIYAMFSFWTAVIYSFIVKKMHGTTMFSDFKS